MRRSGRANHGFSGRQNFLDLGRKLLEAEGLGQEMDVFRILVVAAEGFLGIAGHEDTARSGFSTLTWRTMVGPSMLGMTTSVMIRSILASPALTISSASSPPLASST